VTEVHWRIIARFQIPIPLYRALAAVLLAGAVLLAVLLAGESSRAMLASAGLSCFYCVWRLNDDDERHMEARPALAN